MKLNFSFNKSFYKIKRYSFFTLFLSVFFVTVGEEIVEEEVLPVPTRVHFLPTVQYTVKEPITINSNMGVLDFGTVVKGGKSSIEGHVITVTGSGDIKVEYSVNKTRSETGISISETETRTRNGVKEIELNYLWDTEVGTVNNLEGSRITFTAYYE